MKVRLLITKNWYEWSRWHLNRASTDELGHIIMLQRQIHLNVWRIYSDWDKNIPACCTLMVNNQVPFITKNLFPNSWIYFTSIQALLLGTGYRLSQTTCNSHLFRKLLLKIYRGKIFITKANVNFHLSLISLISSNRK